MTCTRCGSATLVEVPTPEGPHYAKLVCEECGGFIKWLPRPAPAAMPVVDRPDAAPLAEIAAKSEAQAEAARSIRADWLRKCRGAGLARTAKVLSSVIDASWFLANRNRGLDELKWPHPSQLDATLYGRTDEN